MNTTRIQLIQRIDIYFRSTEGAGGSKTCNVVIMKKAVRSVYFKSMMSRKADFIRKNVTKGYSDAQIKVRKATSNDAWGPEGADMAEIAMMTFDRYRSRYP